MGKNSNFFTAKGDMQWSGSSSCSWNMTIGDASLCGRRSRPASKRWRAWMKISARYSGRCERVEQVRQQAQRDRDEALAGLRAKNEQRMQALRRVYTARHDEWLRQIVGRCIGR